MISHKLMTIHSFIHGVFHHWIVYEMGVIVSKIHYRIDETYIIHFQKLSKNSESEETNKAVQS